MKVREYNFGAYRTCASCEKKFFVNYLDDYAYVKYSGVRDAYGKGIKVWFCSWHCLRAWDKTHEKKKKLDYEK